MIGKPISDNNCSVPIKVLHTSDAAMYSASNVDNATHVCFLHDHDTGIPFSSTNPPETDFLSLLLSAQSASEYASTDTFPVPFHFGNFTCPSLNP
jgi:hypothetical protein